jgi:Rps23 Pro-64 3,4-dihydroxylase Tpa1-like proline 4-hydroxylase
MNNNLIYAIHNNLDISFCNSVINYFHEKDNLNLTFSSHIANNIVNKNIRNSISYGFNKSNEIENYYKTILHTKLKNAFKTYLIFLKNYNINLDYINKLDIKILDTGFGITKYIKNHGFYTKHSDFNPTNFANIRLFTYLWYLNDVNEGGETEFIDGTKIKSETGKLIFFPATWPYVHIGNMPISNDKYIIIGWIYLDLQ